MNTPPDNFYLVAATFAMALVTFLTRLTPIILPKRLLDAPLLLAVNKALPLSVMTLLILTSLHWQQPKPISMSLGLSPLLVAEILALQVGLFLCRIIYTSVCTPTISTGVSATSCIPDFFCLALSLRLRCNSSK